MLTIQSDALGVKLGHRRVSEFAIVPPVSHIDCSRNSSDGSQMREAWDLVCLCRSISLMTQSVRVLAAQLAATPVSMPTALVSLSASTVATQRYVSVLYPHPSSKLTPAFSPTNMHQNVHLLPMFCFLTVRRLIQGRNIMLHTLRSLQIID